MCKVSVIIPVYNVERYLSKSISAVLNQTLDDIELICVNDGSTDNSLSILKDFANKDKRVKVFDKANGGCGSARNKGLDNAEGEYVYFFDPDDCILEDTLEKLYVNAENNQSDMVISQVAWCHEGRKPNYDHPGFDLENVFKNVDFENFSFNYKDIPHYVLNSYVAPWIKLYNNNFLKKYSFKFHLNIAFDDVPFHVETMIKAKKLSFIPKAFYHYMINPDSVNHTSSNSADIIRITDIVKDILEDNNIFQEFESEFYEFKIKHLLLYVITSDSEIYYKVVKNEFLRMNLNRDDIPDEILKKYDDLLQSKNYNEYRLNQGANEYLDQMTPLRKEITKKENIIIKQEKELEKLRIENKRLSDENEKIKSINQELMSSNSWKITKPIRKITEIMKK